MMRSFGKCRIAIRAENLLDRYAIIVEDNGPGVPEPMRERVFDPYVTSKEDGDGLGLAIAKKIVVEHGGALTVERSRDLGGAAFTLRLPLAERAPRSSTVSTTPIALAPRA